LTPDSGLGQGHSADELKDPDTNIGIVVKAAKQSTQFSNTTNVSDALTLLWQIGFEGGVFRIPKTRFA
jgi:hypothetical protein